MEGLVIMYHFAEFNYNEQGVIKEKKALMTSRQSKFVNLKTDANSKFVILKAELMFAFKCMPMASGIIGI